MRCHVAICDKRDTQFSTSGDGMLTDPLVWSRAATYARCSRCMPQPSAWPFVHCTELRGRTDHAAVTPVAMPVEMIMLLR